MKIYRIANWQQDFETAETRKLIYLKWVPVPNKHDGLGFKRLACQKNAPELFSAWNLILQVASKGHRDTERGRLIRDGRGLTDEDLAMMTSFPAKIFAAALEFFSSHRMGWLELDNQQVASPPVITGESAVKAGASPAEGIEGREGIEEKGIEEKEADARALLLLTYLNERAGRKFEDCNENLRFIRARLQDCQGDVDGCMQMIDRQCILWIGDHRMENYLRPSTLFNAEKFRSYYDDRSRPSHPPLSNGKPDHRAEKAAREFPETIQAKVLKI